MKRTRVTVGAAWLAAALGVVSSADAQLSQGPDVILQDPSEAAFMGTIGGINAYALGSWTCNVGNQNLIWANNGTPAYAMNAFRLHNGRLVQIGQSWCKRACCAAAGNGCGFGCNGQGGNVLGVGCLDVYGAGWNSQHGFLSPRSGINAWTGAFAGPHNAGGNAIFKRLQIQASDMNPSNFPGAQYFVDGVYVGTDDANAGNRNNNATYRRATVSGTNIAVQGTAAVGKPAIYAWREHGGGPNVVDPSVTIEAVDVPNEGRFFVGNKVLDLGNGRWRYEYAIYNLCSDVAAGSFSVPLASGVVVVPGSVGFKDIDYHSGEVYSNTDWVAVELDDSLVWSSSQTFAQNPNANALRWGTMYNFWFEAESGPVDERGSLGLFKPHTPDSVNVAVLVPAGTPCAADFDESGTVEVPDIFAYLSAWFAGDESADIDGEPGIGVPDIFAFLSLWFAGC